MRRRALLGAVVLLGAAACDGGGTESGPIPIALLAPKTGALDFVGQSFEDVANVAVANINDQGGVNGRELELTVEDTTTNPDVAAQKMQSLVDQGFVAVVGPATSGEVTSAYQVSSPAEVSIISPSSTSPSLSSASLSPSDDGYMFRNVPDDNIQGIAMAYYLRTQRSPTVDSVSVIYEDTPYGEGLKNAFKVVFEDQGGQVNANEVAFAQNLQHKCCAASTSCSDVSCTLEDSLCGEDHTTENPAGPDLTAQPKLCAGPDAIAAINDAAGNGDTLVVMIALEQDAVELTLGWDNEGTPLAPGMEFFMTDGARSGGFLAGAPASVYGMCGTAPTFPVTGLAYATLKDAFEAAFPDKSIDDQVFAPNVWDAFHLFAAAMTQQMTDHPGDEVGGPDLRDAITEISKGGQQINASEWRDIQSSIRSGNDIDYDGAAGPNDFDVVGQAIGPYEVWCVADDGSQFDQALFLNAQDLQAL